MYNWMECGSFDYEYVTGVIPLGSLYPNDEQFTQRGALVEVLKKINLTQRNRARLLRSESYYLSCSELILLSLYKLIKVIFLGLTMAFHV